MIQKYSYGGHEMVFWDSVKDQLEWRDLTPECRPTDYVKFIMWEKEADGPKFAYLIKDDLDENIRLYSGDLTLSVQEIECKWKPLGTNPWR